MNPLSESTDPQSSLKQSDRNRLDRPSAALAGKCTPWKYGAFRDWVLRALEVQSEALRIQGLRGSTAER